MPAILSPSACPAGSDKTARPAGPARAPSHTLRFLCSFSDGRIADLLAEKASLHYYDTMRRRVLVHDLSKGMYVLELDRPWVGTPFLFQGFQIRSDRELEQLRALCAFVYVGAEPEQPPAVRTRESANQAPSPQAAVASSGGIEALLPPQSDLGDTDAAAGHPSTVALEHELGAARELDTATRALVYTIMDDVRMGRTLDSARTRGLMTELVGSVMRNPDALTWMTQLKSRDEYTALHSLRVSILALTFGHHLELPRSELEMLGTGALLHDLGKLRVPDAILNKPDRLTPEEYEIMKTHVPQGVRLLEATPGIPAAALDVARSHHERYRGQGYINGVTGDRIGLFGMIGAIVDTYDAITSDRVYRSGVSGADALRKIYDARGQEFHAGLVERFIQSMGVYPVGSLVELSTGEVGVVLTVNRTRHLRPRISVVLDPHKQKYSQPLALDLYQGSASFISIARVLPAGAYGINSADHIPGATAAPQPVVR